MHRVRSALVVLTGVAAATLLSASPALATTEQALLMSPVDGRVTSSPTEVPPHHTFEGDWAMDVAAPAGTPVHVRFDRPTGGLSLSISTVKESCRVGGGGQNVVVQVHVDGVLLGRVNYLHLAGARGVGPVNNGDQIGVVAGGLPYNPDCWTGPHVHIEPRNEVTYSCHLGVGVGATVGGGTALGVFGGEWASAKNVGCPPGATDPGGTPPPSGPTAQTGGDGANLRTDATRAAPVLTTIPPRTTIGLECWRRGEPVEMSTGTYSLWHRTTYGGHQGFVADAVLNTPAHPDPSADQPRPGEPECPAPAPPSPPPATPPGAPTDVTVTPADHAVVVSWAAAADNGSAVTQYVVEETSGAGSCTTAGELSCTVTGLTPGERYFFAVKAVNAAGAGPASATSGPVSPLDGTRPVPVVRGTTYVCHEQMDGGFSDLDDDSVHTEPIECTGHYGIATGTVDGRYVPGGTVTRGQMASFVARLVDTSGTDLPTDVPDLFDDDAGSVHEQNVNRLAAAGIVVGTGERAYSPERLVGRDQMATFLVRAHAFVTGSTADVPGDYFDDDAGQTHEARINEAAALGLAGGTGPRTYSPGAAVRRDQMATFLARTLDLWASTGHAARLNDVP